MTEAHYYLRAIRYHLLALIGAVLILVTISFITTQGWFGETKTVAQTTQTLTLADCTNWQALAAKDGDQTKVDAPDIAWFEYWYTYSLYGVPNVGAVGDRAFLDLHQDGLVDDDDRQCLYLLTTKTPETPDIRPVEGQCPGYERNISGASKWTPEMLLNLPGYQYLRYAIDQSLVDATSNLVSVWMVPLSTNGSPTPVASLQDMNSLSYTKDFTVELQAQQNNQENLKCLQIPFDLFRFPSQANIGIYACINGSCSAVTRIWGNTSLNFYAPLKNAEVSGVMDITVVAAGSVKKILFGLSSANHPIGSLPVPPPILKSTPDPNNNDIVIYDSTTFDTSLVPNGTYRLDGYYVPISANDDTSLTQPWFYQTFVVNNKTSTTAPAIPSTNTNTSTTLPTNTSTSTVPIAPGISGVIPQQGQALDRLTTIEGKTSRAGYVQVTIAGTSYPSVSTTQTTTGYKFSFTPPSTLGLAPGNQEILVRLCSDVACKNELAKQTNMVTIRQPTAQFLVANGQELTGQVTLYSALTGYLKNPQVLVDKVGGLANISLGSLVSSIENGKTVWKTTVNTSQLPGAGDYTMKIKYLRYDNVISYGPPLSFRVKAATKTSTTLPPTVIAPDPSVIPPVTQPSVTPTTPSTTTATPTNVPAKSYSSYNPDAYIPKVNDDARTSGTVAPTKLNIAKVENTQQPAEQKNLLTFSGVGPPDSIVTIFIYSDPIVVTTRTDADGNWTYTLDNQLGEGQHQAYVTVTTDTGRVLEKSNPLAFFVSQAQAVTEQEFLARNATPERSSDSLLRYYLIMAGLLVGLSLMAVAWWRVGHPFGKFNK